MNNHFDEVKRTSGRNFSYWIDSTEPIKFTPLSGDSSADVVVIGGGIAGVTTAYLLTKEGKKVILLEDGFIASGETGRTTAHLVNVLDDRYTEIESLFGEENSKLAAESHSLAINKIEEIVKTEKINCDFLRLDGYLFLHENDDKTNLEEELKAAVRAGIQAELVTEIPGIKGVIKPALKFPDQAQFHPLKYLKTLSEIIIKNGGKIFTETHVDEINGESVKTNSGYIVKASHIVVATNTPVFNRFVIHTKQAPYRTYVIAAKIPRNSIEKCLWWDTGNHKSKWPVFPYHYVRTQPYNEEYDLLIAGGEDHKIAQALSEGISESDRYELLKNWTKEHFPMIGDIIYQWSGQVMEPVDSLAFIGKNPADKDNIYIATGDSGNGMTHGTIAGILLTDLIMGRENKYQKIYDPGRKTLKTVDVFIEEQVNVAKQYFEYFGKEDESELNFLSLDSGMIVNKNGDKAAVYKDKNGELHFFSAVCPHLKCIVEWNNNEKTFDCPCHGSRFSSFGEVINGPANQNLERLEVNDNIKAK